MRSILREVGVYAVADGPKIWELVRRPEKVQTPISVFSLVCARKAIPDPSVRVDFTRLNRSTRKVRRVVAISMMPERLILLYE